MDPGEVELLAARQQLRAAWTFAAAARRALTPERVSFVEWLLLEALIDLHDPIREGTHQVEVARYVGASERMVSYWFSALMQSGLVNKGPAENARAWSVGITEKGMRTVARCRARLLAPRDS